MNFRLGAFFYEISEIDNIFIRTSSSFNAVLRLSRQTSAGGTEEDQSEKNFSEDPAAWNDPEGDFHPQFLPDE